MKSLKYKKYYAKTPNIELFYRIFIVFIAYILTIVTIIPSHIQRIDLPVVGETVDEPLIVKKNTRYKNDAEMEKRIEYAKLQTSPIFNMPSLALENAERTIKNIFSFIRISQDEKINIDDMYYDFINRFNISINKNVFSSIVLDRDNIDYESKFLYLVNYFYEKPVLSRSNITDEIYELIKNNGILINKYDNYLEEYYIIKKDDIFFLEDLKIKPIIKSEFENLSKTNINILTTFIKTFLSDNIFYNANATLSLSKDLMKNVDPVYINLKKGYTILEAGEKVTESKANLILHIYSDTSVYSIIKLISNALLILSIFTFLAFILVYNKLDIYTDIKKYTFVVFEYIIIILILNFAINNWVYLLNNTYIPFYIYTFIPMFSIINVLLGTRKEVSIALTTSLCLLTGNITSASISETFILFVVSVLASVFAKNINKRSGILLIGVLIGFSYILASILNIANYTNVNITHATLILSFLSGIAQSLTIMIFLPAFEYLLNTATIFKLQELADLNNPLLRELQKKAPGTYHHSLNLGALVETIARDIGENPKLACVSGYYHDIGKLENPLFFIENTNINENRHNGLKPTLSTSIIKSHVKSGVEIAKKHKLPKEVINAIKEHHGTSFIRYFYSKALEENPNVDKAIFVYPGPKPQSKITAIIMLIDSIEAASRTLIQPKREDIEDLIKSIINDKIVTGELNDSGLTLKDIDKIEKLTFKHVITSFHERIKYPKIEEKKVTKNN